MQIFWVRKFYHENEREKKMLETLPWTFNCNYNTNKAFVYIIPYYSNMKNLFSLVGPNFVKE